VCRQGTFIDKPQNFVHQMSQAHPKTFGLAILTPTTATEYCQHIANRSLSATHSIPECRRMGKSTTPQRY
jgi:hypothetical protein